MRTTTGTGASVTGAVVSGIAAYLFTIVGARVLGDVAYAPVGVLWTVQYLVLTVGLLSVEAWVTRDGEVPAVAWRWVVALAAGLGGVVHLTSPSVLGGRSPAWTASAVLIGLGFGVFAIGRGDVASRGDLRTYGLMTGAESTVRLLALLLLAAVATPDGRSVALTLPVGALVVAVTWGFVRRGGRLDGGPGGAGAAAGSVITGRHEGADADAHTRPAAPFLAATTTANAVLQLLLAGGPLLTAAVGAAPALTSIVFVTTTAARAPLVLVYSGLLARLLRAIRRSPASVVRQRTGQAIFAAPVLVLLAAALGWVLGPPLVALTFGRPLRPTAEFAAMTAAAVVAAILLLAANQVLIAHRRSSALWMPWIAALAVGAVAVGLTPDVAGDLRAGLVTLAGLLTAGVLLVPPLRRPPPA